jgi:putative tryptophan/tyrosine transport system substrate-binding protein
MRRRDFTAALLLAAATRSACAQEQAKQHRIAIVIPAGPVALISETGHPFWQAIFGELRRLGDVEGQNLTVERYSGEGRLEGYADLAREVASRNPDVIVALTNEVALAVRAATGTIPIVWTGIEPIRQGLATSLAHPGGNITGFSVEVDAEIWGKRLQILKEAVPSLSKVGLLGIREPYGQQYLQQVREISQRLEVSVLLMLLQESTSSEFQRVFAEIARERPDGILVSARGDFVPYRQLIVELVEKNRLPAMYSWREYVEAGGLMAYAGDHGEEGRRIADDVHEILNGAKPGDIPIYQATKFDLLINLKAAKAIGLTLPQSLLASADEVIE